MIKKGQYAVYCNTNTLRCKGIFRKPPRAILEKINAQSADGGKEREKIFLLRELHADLFRGRKGRFNKLHALGQVPEQLEHAFTGGRQGVFPESGGIIELSRVVFAYLRKGFFPAAALNGAQAVGVEKGTAALIGI